MCYEHMYNRKQLRQGREALYGHLGLITLYQDPAITISLDDVPDRNSFGNRWAR